MILVQYCLLLRQASYLVQKRQSKVRRYVHEYAFIPTMVPKNLENL